jgi:hypothetical protein
MMRDEGRGESGAILALVLIVLAILLTGGGLALYTITGEIRGAGQERLGRDAFYCAEAGLQAGRDFVAAEIANWNAMLDPGLVDPSGYPVCGKAISKAAKCSVDSDCSAGEACVTVAGAKRCTTTRTRLSTCDGTEDFRVTISDNCDELPPLNCATQTTGAGQYADNDLTVILRSECKMSGAGGRTQQEWVTFTGAGKNYRGQGGQGGGGTGNVN